MRREVEEFMLKIYVYVKNGSFKNVSSLVVHALLRKILDPSLLGF